MSLISGKYQHYKNENIEDYFCALGVPYLVRKTIPLMSPLLEITLDGNKVHVKVNSKVFSKQNTYTLDVEEDEVLPLATMRSKTTIKNDNEMQTDSVSPKNNLKHTRHYYFTEDELIMTLSHDKSNVKGKRYFRRLK